MLELTNSAAVASETRPGAIERQWLREPDALYRTSKKSTVRCYRKVRLYKRLKKKKWALSRFFLFRGASILDSLLQDPTYSRVAFGHPPVLHEVTLSLHVASLLIPTVILFPFSFFIALFALFILGSAHSFLYPVRCRLPPSSPPHTTSDDNFSFFFFLLPCLSLVSSSASVVNQLQLCSFFFVRDRIYTHEASIRRKIRSGKIVEPLHSHLYA